MAEIVFFPTESTAEAEPRPDASRDRFLLDEGLELLADFRSIDDSDVRISLRKLVKSMSIASRKAARAGD